MVQTTLLRLHRVDPDHAAHSGSYFSLKLSVMLRGAPSRTKSEGTASPNCYRCGALVRHPCLGCGAFSIRSCVQFKVHSVADCPSRFQNWVVAYIACTGCPAPPARVSNVVGRLAMLNASCGAAQIRSPGAQISLV